MAAKHEIINPPNKLKTKVKIGGSKAVDPDVLARAEAVITDLAGEYLEWVEGDLSNIQKAWEGLKTDPSAKACLDQIYQVSHDIKGQGGSFGYQLMTVIGDKLCRYIEKVESVGAREVEVIRLHIDAMRLVISKRVEGDGGSVGGELLKGLSRVSAKASN